MTVREKKELALTLTRRLCEVYPSGECALEYNGDAWRLLCMAILSAQCTDKRVNEVSVELFSRFPTAEALADAPLDDIAEIIRPCGLYTAKAKHLKESSRILVSDFGGELPSDMDSLLTFSGVGRKVANLLRGDIFGLGGIVVDTHFMRICARLGFYPETLRDPAKIERIFTPLLAREYHTGLCHRIVFFGRDYCSARSPLCTECPINDICRKYQKGNKDRRIK